MRSANGWSLRTSVAALMLAPARTRAMLAFLAGASGALALQPFDLLPVFVITFSVLVLLVDAAAAERKGLRADLLSAGFQGWCFGFGYFLASLWWLGQAFITRGADFIWLMPLGVIALPMGLALFFAFGVMIARLLWSQGALRLFALAFGLAVSEWLRGWIFTGFPWNGFGQAFANHLVLAQGASLIGAEGLGMLTPLVFGAPALLLTGRSAAGRFVLPMASICALVALGGFGYARLAAAGGIGVDFSRQPMVEGVKLRIVQPSTPQDEKWSPQEGRRILANLLALSDTARGAHASGMADVTHLIWPESPFPFVLENTPEAVGTITAALPPGTVLLTGAIRTQEVAGERQYFNTLHVIDKLGIKGTYDKVHLVPFGEYLPFDRALRAIGLEQFVKVIGGFTAGPQRRALRVPGLPHAVPLICFEAIFAREIAPALGDDGMMLTLTNDVWFGNTPGPYQHLALSRLRAIEFGQPMVRAANSGISAVFDAYGRSLVQLPFGVADILDSPLPKATTKTLYRVSNWYSFAPVMICLLIMGLVGRARTALA